MNWDQWMDQWIAETERQREVIDREVKSLIASGEWIDCAQLKPAPFTVVMAKMPDGTETLLGYVSYHTPRERYWTTRGADGMWNMRMSAPDPTHWKLDERGR